MTLLVSWLWQGLAVSLGAALVLRACPRLDAATRHVTWWAVLAAVMSLPFVQPTGGSAVTAAGLSDGFGRSGPATPLLLPAVPDWLVAVVVGAWIGSVLLGLTRVLRSLRFVARLMRESTPLPESRQQSLRHWVATRTTGRRVRLLVSDHVRTASAVGLGHAAIVLPVALAEALDDEALDQVVMHEHAHLQRLDDVWRLAQALVECVAGLHPGVRIAVRGIDIEREAACDDRVIARTGCPRAYASCLAEAAALASTRRVAFEPSLLPGAVHRSSVLRTRVRRLLDSDRRHGVRFAPHAALAGMVALAACLGVVAQVDPVIAFDVRLAVPGTAPVPIVAREPDVRAPHGGLDGSPRPAPPVPGARTPLQASATAVPPQAPGTTATPEPTAPPMPVAQPIHVLDMPPSPLASRVLDVTHDPPQPVTAGDRLPVVAGDRAQPWAAGADGGAAIGSAARRSGLAAGVGAKKTGTAVAGFFTRAGRAIAGTF